MDPGEKMKLNGAQIIVKSLEAHGIETVAGIPGGSNLPLYDALSKSGITHILARHEQGAGFIAHGMARSTGKTAVCMATSGPGVTNLVTALADAKLDSVPIVAITGQVPTSMIGTDAFQEVDTCGMTFGMTKHNFLVQDVRELAHVMDEAFRIAASGRPGPVLVDVPKDIQTAVIDLPEWKDDTTDETHPVGEDILMEAAAMINSAERPVIYAGGGIISSDSSGLLAALAEKSSLPVALTLMGLGAFPCDHDLCLGMLGMHARLSTNLILNEADLLIVLGARFDDRATGAAEEFCPGADILHVDIDRAEINKIRNASLSVSADVKVFLEGIIPFIETTERSEWISYIDDTGKSDSDDRGEGRWKANNFIKTVGMILPDDAIITTDVGKHQMWVAQSYPFRSPRTLLTSGGLGTMGFGLPAAIGAALANPNKKVVCFSGDGSILMNIQELATLADLDLDVKIIVMNNKSLGLVCQQQELFFKGNVYASRFSNGMDFSEVSRAFGVKGLSISASENPLEDLKTALLEKGPCVIDVRVSSNEMVLPMVPPGKSNTEMITGERISACHDLQDSMKV